MENNFNLKIDVFRQQLLQIISNSNLPVSVVVYIIKDIYNEINDLYKQAVMNEYEESVAAQKEQEEQDNAIKENAEQE